MKAYSLPKFGIENLRIVELPDPQPGPGEVLVRMEAASVNYRDYQIVTGEFAPTQPLPIIPMSDGAGVVEAVGDGVEEFSPGDRVTPLFFPEWTGGPALADERKVSSGLEAPGVLRELAVYAEHQVVHAAGHLSAAEAACFPCAGVTAWKSLVPNADIQPGDWVLVQGTGGVSLMGLQIARSLGARVIVTSSSDEKLARASELGADAVINYTKVPEWGAEARAIAGGTGVNAILEIGGTGTLRQSLAALARDGHINIIGYLAGIDAGLSVFDFIERNAHVHGISVGSRDDAQALMDCAAEGEWHPVVDREYAFEDAAKALSDIASGGHFGKLVVRIGS